MENTKKGWNGMLEEQNEDGGRSPKIYTVRDVARILRFDNDKIYGMNKRGELPAPLPLGRSLRWNGRQFDRWVEDGCPMPKKRRK